MTTLLAGDIGGTKTLLSLYGLGPDNQLNLIHSQRYRSADWASLEPMLQAFLADTADRAERPAAACFAVAGPVQHGRARLTNLPWQLEQKALAAATGITWGMLRSHPRPDRGGILWPRNDRIAAGLLLALREGISPAALRRPL